MKILIINGPNLNLLGKRQPTIYGEVTFEYFLEQLDKENVEIDCYQSNVEGEIINKLHDSDADALVLNAGGYTHTSVAIRDAVDAIHKPVVEVHISNIASRESFRHDSLISPVAVGCIFGFGLSSYELAIDYLIKYHKEV
ncbi:MAG: type II 3-dehydroquinate dehydratase [Brumimicrobium sp.]